MSDMTAEQALAEFIEGTGINRGRDFESGFLHGYAIAMDDAALTAPRVPEGLRELMQDLIDYAQSGKVAEPWMVERLEAILTAAPAPAGTHLDVGGRYNFIGQPDRLVYVGRSSGGWHQFEKVEAPGIIWAEIRDSELHLIERSAPAPADPFTHSAELHASRRNGLPTPAPAEQVTKVGAMEVTHDADGRVSKVDCPMPLFTTTEGEEVKRLRERYDDLLAKHQEVLDTVQQCACAYDGPKDVCVGHAKEMATLRERVNVLEAALSAINEREDAANALDKLAGDMAFIADLRAEVEALKGPGYVRVPVEPTAEMIRKGQGQWSGESMVEIYKAMLAAATQETSHD